MATGYEDLENLEKQQNEILNQQGTTQNNIINQQTQMQVDELNRNKEKVDKDVQKTNQALYTQYQKESNQFGANAEKLASQGLANSGYAETTKANMFGTYQKNVTETLNNARDLKSDYDFQVSQARQNGSIQQAQAQLEIYSQKLQYLTQNYQLKQNREQYIYQQGRDKISDDQWQKTYDEQIRQNELENEWKQKQYDYQAKRDAVSDEQWQKQYNLSARRSSSSSSNVNIENTEKQYTLKEVLDNAKLLQGAKADGTGVTDVRDGISGKTFTSMKELLKYYDV